MDEEIIKKMLEDNPNAVRAADGIIIKSEDGSFLHLTGMWKKEDLEGLTEDEHWFVAFCSKQEIVRLRSLRNAYDYLLRLRAMAIVDEPRAVRVMRRRRKEFTSKGAKWSLTDYYRTKDFYHKSYLNRLCPSYRKRLINIPSGFAFVNEANAICMRSLLGEVVIVSECLENFYYFMTLAFMGGDLNIPTHDRLNALLIAFRIMNGAESLDFEIDPRGNLPIEIEEKIQGYVRSQMEFTYGHEYSHYLLGHLNNSNLKPMAMFDATDKSVIWA